MFLVMGVIMMKGVGWVSEVEGNVLCGEMMQKKVDVVFDFI